MLLPRDCIALHQLEKRMKSSAEKFEVFMSKLTVYTENIGSTPLDDEGHDRCAEGAKMQYPKAEMTQSSDLNSLECRLADAAPRPCSSVTKGDQFQDGVAMNKTESTGSWPAQDAECLPA